MGRSTGSRNRKFRQEGAGKIYTEVADPGTATGNPDLIIYNAMDEIADHDCFVVSNGRQTDAIVSGSMHDNGLQESLLDYEYEPDEPNFTPRISGIICANPFTGIQLSLLRKSPFSASCDRSMWSYDHLEGGFGYCLTTYSGDGNPLPAFHGEPILMPLQGDIDTILKAYWEKLNSDNRVSIAVKFISIDSTHTPRSTIKLHNRFW